MKTTLLLCVLLVGAIALYEPDSKVVKLTADNFQSLVLDGDDLWLIEFYAPWCGHCKKLAPEFDKAAKALEGIVRLGAVDMTTDGDAGRDYDVSSYPTIKFFGRDKHQPVNYDGDRKKAGIIDYCLDRARELALSRLGVKVTNPSTGDDKDVVVLTDANFDSHVFGSEKPWFVEFYAPWCKHCKKLAPEWAKLATKLKGDMNIAKVDATTETELAQRFKVEGFPSLKFFPAKIEDDDKVEEFGGDREYNDLLSYAKKKLGNLKAQQKAAAGVNLEQLSDQAVFNQKCSNSKTCVIAFLPPLPQSSTEERQQYIQIIKDTAAQAKQSSYFYLWATGGDFEEFEAEVNVLGSGYPQVVAINSKNSRFYNYRAGFNAESVAKFVEGVANNSESSEDYVELPTLKVKQRKDDL